MPRQRAGNDRKLRPQRQQPLDSPSGAVPSRQLRAPTKPIVLSNHSHAACIKLALPARRARMTNGSRQHPQLCAWHSAHACAAEQHQPPTPPPPSQQQQQQQPQQKHPPVTRPHIAHQAPSRPPKPRQTCAATTTAAAIQYGILFVECDATALVCHAPSLASSCHGLAHGPGFADTRSEPER